MGRQTVENAVTQLDRINERFLDAINSRGHILLSPLRSVHDRDGELCVRMAILSFRTHHDRLELGLEDIRWAAAELELLHETASIHADAG